MSYIEYQVRVLENGTKEWYLNDPRHRKDGPAVECVHGDKQWFLNSRLHRVDGPATEYANGNKRWFLNGKELTEVEFQQRTNPVTCEGKVVEIDGKKYQLKLV